jgi:hypothetical protein
MRDVLYFAKSFISGSEDGIIWSRGAEQYLPETPLPVDSKDCVRDAGVDRDFKHLEQPGNKSTLRYGGLLWKQHASRTR